MLKAAETTWAAARGNHHVRDKPCREVIAFPSNNTRKAFLRTREEDMHARSTTCLFALALLLASLVHAHANPEFKLRFGSYAPEGDVIDRAAHHFKDSVARLTNG